MVQKKMYRKHAKSRLLEVKESVVAFNSKFDKRVKAGLPSCWVEQGILLSWEQYETLLVEAKSKTNSSHEKTTILKGATILNHLQRHFQLLWLVKTLFTNKPTYTKVTNLRMAYSRMPHCLVLELTLWKKCLNLISLIKV